jgi:hypothetical protein
MRLRAYCAVTDEDIDNLRLRFVRSAVVISAAFLIALAMATIVLVIFGFGERGATIALRATARWSFLLFWLAYAGGSIAWLWPRLSGLGRYGRDLGLAYASAQLIHVGLVLWLIHVATGPSGAMLFFWIGIFCSCLLVLFSLPRFREALEPASLAPFTSHCIRGRFCHAALARDSPSSRSATCIYSPPC